MVAAEAAAAGTASVITDCCGVAELLADRGALVVPCEVEPLRDAIGRLLAEPELRRGLGEGGKAVARETTWDDVATRQVADLPQRGGQDMSDLLVVGQDPRFRRRARALMRAFLDAARALGRDPELLYVPHPSFHPDDGHSPLDRMEALRIVRGSRRLAPMLTGPQPLWVVAALATQRLRKRHARGVRMRAGSQRRSPTRTADDWAACRRRDGSRRTQTRRFCRGSSGVFVQGAAHVYAISSASRRSLATAAAPLPEERIEVMPIPVGPRALRARIRRAMACATPPPRACSESVAATIRARTCSLRSTRYRSCGLGFLQPPCG